MNVICRKCFIGVQAEQYSALIEKCRERIPEKERVTDDEFARRIAECECCGQFNAATCQACGCYVEIRAMKKGIHCPNKKW